MSELGERIAAAVGARLRELRLERGLTQAEVSRRTGIHRPIVARLERGRHCQGLDSVCRYAAALGVSPLAVLSVLEPAPVAAGFLAPA